MNIYDLIKRAQELRDTTQMDSVSPELVGKLHEDTLKYINEYQLLASSPAIHKTYASVSAMQGDASPKSDLTGRALLKGQLVIIVPASSTDATAGDVYRYNGPSGNTSGWTYVAKIGGVPADAELDSTSINAVSNMAVAANILSLKGITAQTETKSFAYGGKAYADFTLPYYLVPGMVLTDLGVASAAYLKKKDGTTISVYSSLVPYTIEDEIVAFQVNTEEEGELTVKGKLAKKFEEIESDIASNGSSLKVIQEELPILTSEIGQTKINKIPYGGKAYADLALPYYLVPGMVLTDLGVASAVYLKKKDGKTINVYSNLVPYTIEDEIVAFQVNTEEEGELTVKGKFANELGRLEDEIEDQREELNSIKGSINPSLGNQTETVVTGNITDNERAIFFAENSSRDYLTYIRKVTPGEKIVIYTDALFNGWDSLAAFTNAENPLSASAQKINGKNLTLVVGYNEIVVPESATYLGMTIKFASSLGAAENKIIASYSDYAIVQKIKSLEETAREEGGSVDLTELKYQHGKVVTGYITDNARSAFFAENPSTNYLTCIRKVTPGERLVIYTDALFGGWDSMAAFTNAENPLSASAQKIDSKNLTLVVGYNEIVVPESATYLGMTIKFASSLGAAENKIIASYSDYAMVQRIKLLEEAKNDTGRDKVKVKYEKGIVSIATLWDDQNDLVKRVDYDNLSANQNINLIDAFIGKKGTFAKDVLIKSCGDDICPANVNSGYIGGNHGWNAANKVIVSSHDKTIADVGSVYEDTSGVKFILLEVIDSTTLLLCSENKATEENNYRFYSPVGELRYVSNGKSQTSINPTNVSNYGNLYGCIVPSHKKMLIDGNVITSYGEYFGEEIALVESYDVMDLPSILTALVSNRPINGYASQPILYNLPGVQRLFNHKVAYRFDIHGTTLVTTTIRAYRPLYLNFHGFVQAGVMEGNAKLYCPKTLPIQVGEKQFDLRTITDWEESPSSNIIMAPAYWENRESAPDRVVMMNDDAVFACGYVLDRGKLAEPREDLVAKYAMHFSENRKLYPMGICPSSPFLMQSNDYISAVAYRTYYKAENKSRTNLSVFEVGDMAYIYADYHGEIEDDLPVKPHWLGKRISVVEKNERCNIYEDVVTGNIRVDSTASSNNYGYIVLRIE